MRNAECGNAELDAVSGFVIPSSFVIRHLLGSYACRRGDRSGNLSNSSLDHDFWEWSG